MHFNPSTDIPDLTGKVIIVTGGSSGLGKESIHQLVKHNPSKIYLSARTSQRANAAIQEIESATPAAKGKIHHLEVDMSSFASVSKAAQRILAENNRLDVLLNNAGGMGSDAGVTTDGYEDQFGSNYMGPTLFTKLLLPLLLKSAQQPNADVRIVNLSSELFKQAPSGGILFDQLTTPMADVGSIAKYGQSKLANYFFSKVMAEKYPAIKSVALHPGVVNTGFFDEFQKKRPYLGWAFGFFISPFLTNVHDGAKMQLWASTANTKHVRNGAMYMSNGKEYTQSILTDDKLANKLWDWTDKEFSSHGF